MRALVKSGIVTVAMIILTVHPSSAQTASTIDSLLSLAGNTKDSREIVNSPATKEIMKYGEDALKLLAEFFTDKTPTSTKSECQKRDLVKGDLAIIIADRIEVMPYALLTGIQNCTMESCDNNPNFIEIYLSAIKRDGYEEFRLKYLDWLKSEGREGWAKSFKKE